mmetsp:Transcript_5479/g.8550  ORF Transcript_5479/g.8550 Transcript_5479/m.8550 type:complete len:82 (-) Transcript_5479:94-339(-)
MLQKKPEEEEKTIVESKNNTHSYIFTNTNKRRGSIAPSMLPQNTESKESGSSGGQVVALKNESKSKLHDKIGDRLRQKIKF